MNKMMIGISSALLIGFAFAMVPTASASLNTCDPTFTACVSDDSFSSGDCNNGYKYGFDQASAYAPTGDFAYVSGYSYCDGFGGYSFTGSGVGAGGCDFNTGACAFVGWYSYGGSFGSGCDSYVYAVVLFQDVGCPAGAPPNPGWGTLTP